MAEPEDKFGAQPGAVELQGLIGNLGLVFVNFTPATSIAAWAEARARLRKGASSFSMMSPDL